MADIDLKTETPDTSLPTTGFLFGADSQAASAPSVYSTQTVATTLLGSTSLTGATVTTSSPVLDLSQTWNASGVTFTGLRFNAAGTSDANSASGSLLMDLQVGGSSRFSVSKAGTVTVPSSIVGGFSIGSTASNYISFWTGSGLGTSLVGGSAQLHVKNANVTISNAQLTFEPTANVGNSSDLFLGRRAAANLRLGAADVGATTSTVTITIAAPGVVTWSGHGFSTGTPVVFTTTGALPTGITAGTTYYAVVVDANTFQIASSVANAIATPATVITTSGTQSGTHTGTRYNITQRLGMQSVTGVTDRLGADLVIQGSQGTGTGAGGSIIFQVAPAGSSGTAQNALATALTIAGSRVATFSAGVIFNDYVQAGTVGLNYYGSGQINLSSTSILGWGSAGIATAPDTILARDAANTLALRNGANAQTFNVYNTYTDASNYERLSLFWNSNLATIFVDKAGTGQTRNLALQSYGTIRLLPGNTDCVEFSSSLVSVFDGKNIQLGTTNGTKIGTATSQKIGFWNATPIVQPTTAVAAATVAATGTGDVVAASTTFDGYTIPQIVKALRNAGLLA